MHKRVITGSLCLLNDVRLLRVRHLVLTVKPFDLGDRVGKRIYYMQRN
jgi:hypothetical protein